jgi:digeranylgeranylglycerophospholipid reductase
VRGTAAKPYLDKFLKRHPETFGDSKILSVGAAPLVVSGQLDKSVSDNVMIAGEAAGHVMPFTGAGIHSGLVAGRIAGSLAAEAITDEDYSESRLSGYAVEYDRIFGDRIRRSLKSLKVIERLSDGELNTMAELLKGQDILDIANGMNLERAAKMIMKHPVLAMKVAKALIS